MFEPYIKQLPITGCDCIFFYGTQQAKEWYDPLKPYALLEYEWVLEKIELKSQKIIDVGAHHGQYSVIFGAASEGTSRLVSVDPVPMNLDLTRVNLVLNGLKPDLCQCAVSNCDGTVFFQMESNGRIVEQGGVEIVSRRLSTILPDATVIKIDVEGAEFDILPNQIDDLANAQTWIVEMHPSNTKDPNKLIDLFRERNFKILWVNRDKLKVEPYPIHPIWNSHTTVFFLRK